MISLVLVAAVFLLAGFVKGVIGMGLPTVGIGLLGLMMPPAEAAAILVVPSLVTNVWQALAGGHLRDVARRLWPMLIGICVGTFIGALFLPSANGGEATIWLGLALVIYAAFGLCNIHLRTPKPHESWIGALVGVATGVVSLATAVFAIPGVPFVQSLGFDRDRLVQALGLSFTTSTIALGAALSHAGTMTLAVAAPAAAALLAVMAGMILGQKVRGLASPQTFRLCFFIGLLVLGAHLALRGLL